MQEKVLESTRLYFKKMKNTYILIFGMYLGVSMAVLIITVSLIFKKTKKDLLNVNNMLVLLPLSEMTHKERHDIENHLSQW